MDEIVELWRKPLKRDDRSDISENKKNQNLRPHSKYSLVGDPCVTEPNFLKNLLQARKRKHQESKPSDTEETSFGAKNSKLFKTTDTARNEHEGRSDIITKQIESQPKNTTMVCVFLDKSATPTVMKDILPCISRMEPSDHELSTLKSPAKSSPKRRKRRTESSFAKSLKKRIKELEVIAEKYQALQELAEKAVSFNNSRTYFPYNETDISRNISQTRSDATSKMNEQSKSIIQDSSIISQTKVGEIATVKNTPNLNSKSSMPSFTVPDKKGTEEVGKSTILSEAVFKEPPLNAMSVGDNKEKDLKPINPLTVTSGPFTFESPDFPIGGMDQPKVMKEVIEKSAPIHIEPNSAFELETNIFEKKNTQSGLDILKGPVNIFSSNQEESKGTTPKLVGLPDLSSFGKSFKSPFANVPQTTDTKPQTKPFNSFASLAQPTSVGDKSEDATKPIFPSFKVDESSSTKPFTFLSSFGNNTVKTSETVPLNVADNKECPLGMETNIAVTQPETKAPFFPSFGSTSVVPVVTQTSSLNLLPVQSTAQTSSLFTSMGSTFPSFDSHPEKLAPKLNPFPIASTAQSTTNFFSQPSTSTFTVPSTGTNSTTTSSFPSFGFVSNMNSTTTASSSTMPTFPPFTSTTNKEPLFGFGGSFQTKTTDAAPSFPAFNTNISDNSFNFTPSVQQSSQPSVSNSNPFSFQQPQSTASGFSFSTPTMASFGSSFQPTSSSQPLFSSFMNKTPEANQAPSFQFNAPNIQFTNTNLGSNPVGTQGQTNPFALNTPDPGSQMSTGGSALAMQRRKTAKRRLNKM